MSNDILHVIQKYKHPIIMSLIVTALALYVLPLEKLFSNDATAQSREQRDNTRYQNVRQGPPADTRGQGPPADTPGQGPPADRGPPAPRNR